MNSKNCQQPHPIICLSNCACHGPVPIDILHDYIPLRMEGINYGWQLLHIAINSCTCCTVFEFLNNSRTHTLYGIDEDVPFALQQFYTLIYVYTYICMKSLSDQWLIIFQAAKFVNVHNNP